MPGPVEPAPLPNPRARNAHWRAVQWVVRIVCTFWLGYRARGVERLDREGGALLLMNHQSHLDPLLVGAPMRRPISFLARDSLFRVPFVGWVLRNAYVLPINREAATTAALREMLRRIEHGFLVGIFPEGTRSATGAVGELKPGFISVLKRSKAPMYPVGIAGAYQAFPRKAWFLRPGRIRVVFGEPVPPETWERFGRDDAALIAFVREKLCDVQAQAEQWRAGQQPPPSQA